MEKEVGRELGNQKRSGTCFKNPPDRAVDHNDLHKALDFAVKMQFISKNPADYAVPPVIKHKEFQPLTPREVTRLLKACAQKEVLLPVILATTLGLRRGEALGLQWNDVDFQTGTLTIRRQTVFDQRSSASVPNRVDGQRPSDDSFSRFETPVCQAHDKNF